MINFVHLETYSSVLSLVSERLLHFTISDPEYVRMYEYIAWRS